jgi:preprotein translocase subunit YajC
MIDLSTGPLVLAQAPPGAALQQFLPLILILVVFYFLLVRPQQRRAKEHKQMLANLKRNDAVVTAGGIHGRVIELSEDVVTLEIAPNVRVKHDRSQVTGLQDAKKEG